MVLRVTPRRDAAALATIFYAFGTVAWYAAMLGSTWFLAHVVASTFLFLAITAALDAERRERLTAAGAACSASSGASTARQFLAGLLFGIAALARLTTIFGAPFFVFVGGGGSWFRRAVSAGLGAAIPVLLLLGYNLATTGHVFHPAYDYLRQNEYHPPGGSCTTRTGASRTCATSPATPRSCCFWLRRGRSTPSDAGPCRRRSGLGSLLDRTAPSSSRTPWA